jgi:hypothetical protein
MKIFWSWQSDTLGKTGRHLVRDALKAAIEELKQPVDLEEPTTQLNRETLHLDHDRQGVSGSPDLARTIFDKIDQAAVFIADVTPVSKIAGTLVNRKRQPGKRNMNPNVAVELGYAMKAIGDGNILMVLNTFHGDRKYLPFDLAHKAGPIEYHLAPDATAAERKTVLAELAGKFVTMLRDYLPAGQLPEPEPVFEVSTGASSAVYFQAGETLAEIGEPYDAVSFNYPNGAGFYLRVRPAKTPAEPFSHQELRQFLLTRRLDAIWRNPSGLIAVNDYGAIVFEPRSPTGGSIVTSSQLFPSGEIWGFAPYLLKDIDQGKFIPVQAFESIFRKSLQQYVRYLENVIKLPPPYSVRAGAAGLRGYRVAIDQLDQRYGPIHNDDFHVEKILNQTTQAVQDEFLLELYNKLFRQSGFPRPGGLFGFPPPVGA